MSKIEKIDFFELEKSEWKAVSAWVFSHMSSLLGIFLSVRVVWTWFKVRWIALILGRVKHTQTMGLTHLEKILQAFEVSRSAFFHHIMPKMGWNWCPKNGFSRLKNMFSKFFWNVFRMCLGCQNIMFRMYLTYLEPHTVTQDILEVFLRILDRNERKYDFFKPKISFTSHTGK